MSTLIKEIAMVTSPNQEETLSVIFANFATDTLEFISFVHKCHWKENSAQMHTILGELYDALDEAVDEYAEACIGSGLFLKDHISMGASFSYGEDCFTAIEFFSKMLSHKIALASGVPEFAAVLDKLVDMQEALNKFTYLRTQQ
jgi:hypothetical protein